MLDLISETSRLKETTSERVGFALRGLIQLTNARIGVMARVSRSANGPAIIEAFVDRGWEGGGERETLIEAATQPGYADTVLESGFETMRLSGGSRTFGRRDHIGCRDWYSSQHYSDVRKPAGIDECLYSIHHLPGTGNFVCLGLHRGADDRTLFGAREQKIADYVWHSLRFLHEAPLDPTDAKLNDRLQQVLVVLRSSTPMRSAYRRLGLTRGQFESAARRIYRHYGVCSRLELVVKLGEM